MDVQRLIVRGSKAFAFFQEDPSRNCHLYPRPWRLPVVPYYLVQGLDNGDGHGGYTSGYQFDRDGVPYRCAMNGREIYHPLVIARYVLRMLSLSAITGDQGAYAATEPAVAALAKSGAPTGVWRVGTSVLDMSGDEPSCIIQAAAISALVRVGQRNFNGVLDDVLRRAVKALVFPAGGGGTVTHTPEGPFFEEFNSRSHVLNGCVYGLWALYDLIDGMACSELKPLAKSVESCLARLAPQFTIGNGWSLYALDVYGYASLASIQYHRAHIRMFRLLGIRTGNAAFGNAAERWERALDSRSVRCVILARKCAQVVWMRDVLRLPLCEKS